MSLNSEYRLFDMVYNWFSKFNFLPKFQMLSKEVEIKSFDGVEVSINFASLFLISFENISYTVSVFF